MQDAIILYENGKAIGGEGHPTNASDITFENTGTDLEAETAQAAIVEVYEATKHGIYEVWVNSSPSSAFAGQSLPSITTDETIDTFFIEANNGLVYSVENVSGSTALTQAAVRTAQGQVRYIVRQVTLAVSGNTTTISFADCTIYDLTSYGSAATGTTGNSNLVPLRIFGIIHND